MLMTHHRKNPALRPDREPHQIRGFSLIEVLVTIVILLIGLLGLAGLQGRALNAQMEAYQRSQALVLVKDMAGRIEANRKNASAYINNNPLGVGGTCPSGTTRAELDLCDWHNALLGTAETQGTANVGAMIGARGCVYEIAAPASGVPGEYRVAVAWQGLNSTFAPTIPCGANQYPNTTSPKEALRRLVALPVSIADLKD